MVQGLINAIVSAVNFVHGWYIDLYKDNKTVIWAAVGCVILSWVVWKFIQDIDVLFWGGVVMYGLITYFYGKFDAGPDSKHIRTRTELPESEEVFGRQIDPLSIRQIFVVAFSASLFVGGVILNDFIWDVLPSLTDFQIIGAIILISRFGIAITTPVHITHGLWARSTYILGLLLFLLPFFGLYPWFNLSIALIVATVVFLHDQDVISLETVTNLDEWMTN